MSHGIIPNRTVFFYLSYLLSLAKDGHPINPALLEKTASHFHVFKSTISKCISLSYHRMYNPPPLPTNKRKEIVYPLIQQLLLELNDIQMPKEIHNIYFCRLRELRTNHHLTQAQVADYLGMRRNQYVRYEDGSRLIPVFALLALVELYHTSSDYILNLTDDPRPKRRL